MLRTFTSLLLLGSVATLARGAERLNVIVIVADDLGGRDLGCYGSTYHRTPHLDRLAARGTRFTDAYAACPVCSPTRAALLTGKYPSRLHLTDWLPGRPDRPDQKLLRPAIRQQLPLAEITLAESLQAAGYATGHIGKWHLGGAGFGPLQQGFDVNIAGDQAGSPRSYFAPYRGRDGAFIPGLEKAPDGEYLTDRLTDEAVRFIERERGRPFFLYLAHFAPHIPLRARAEKIAKYPKDTTVGRQSNAIYAAMLESLDDGVGRIVKTLDDLKLTARTAIVFTSDNGGLCVLEGPNTPATINAPYREGKGYLYEGGLRVPLIVHWPGVTRPGSVATAAVSSIDLTPTVLDLCGARNNVAVDGVSLRPVLRGDDKLPRDMLCWHYPHYSNQGGRPGGAIRVGDHKLIEFYENGRRELYDLSKDAGEARNLALEKADVVKDLADRLSAWRRSVDAQMPRPNPDFVPNPQAADGIIQLPARTAEVHGVQLRYEPLPHKNTLGYWIRQEDWASWEFTVTKPGTFEMEILQGCGKGSGGAEVEFTIGAQSLRTIVEDTGHFQNFKPRLLGTVKIEKAGRHTLTVRPKTKPGVAVMDLRSVTLNPVEQ